MKFWLFGMLFTSHTALSMISSTPLDLLPVWGSHKRQGEVDKYEKCHAWSTITSWRVLSEIVLVMQNSQTQPSLFRLFPLTSAYYIFQNMHINKYFTQPWRCRHSAPDTLLTVMSHRTAAQSHCRKNLTSRLQTEWWWWMAKMWSSLTEICLFLRWSKSLKCISVTRVLHTNAGRIFFCFCGCLPKFHIELHTLFHISHFTFTTDLNVYKKQYFIHWYKASTASKLGSIWNELFTVSVGYVTDVNKASSDLIVSVI
jgi:hypothetical protein